jgi:hypothetical protein
MLNKNIIFIVFFTTFLWGCGATPPSIREQGVAYQKEDVQILPKIIFITESEESKVQTAPFFGLLKTDTGREGASIMYQGGAGLAGFFAQVLTHAVMENEAQKKVLKEAQEEADRVLKNYEDLILQNTVSSLIQSSVEQLGSSNPVISIVNAESGVENENRLFIESLPIYYMSQDQKSIVLEHQLSAYYSDEPEKIIYQNMAKAISKKQNIEEDASRWKANSGELFFEATADLHLSSLNVLLKDMYKNLNSQTNEATHKYYIGEKKYYVRGKVLHEDCGYRAIRNLKGNILIFQTDNASNDVSKTCLYSSSI